MAPVRITNPPDHAVFRAPVDIPIFAFARGMGILAGAITNVEFFANDVDLGRGQSLPFLRRPPFPVFPLAVFDEYSLVWTNAPAGSYALMVKATDIRGKSSTSVSPVRITVLPATAPATNWPDVVSLVANDPVAIEGTNCWVWRGWTNAPTWTNWPPPRWQLFTNCGPKNASFLVQRFGDSSANLTVPYTLGGTASNGVDYVALSGSVTIPAGAAYTLLPLVPIDDGLPQSNKTVVVTLAPPPNSSSGYVLGLPRRAAALIIDGTSPRPLTGLLPGGAFHVNANGPDGAWFSVQYSTNMANWLSVGTNQVVGGSIDFVDPDAPVDSGRFYRAVPQAGPPQ
jgi:hypothetical protein